MKLAISNIGWGAEKDSSVYSLMRDYGVTGLEIAPTRIFPEAPYDKLEAASAWAIGLKKRYGFVIPSMQSIWYGRQEKLFGAEDERQILLAYTQKAINFAAAIGCGNLVFGCPRNRVIPDNVDSQIGVHFFREAGNYAAEKGTVIGMEANPPIYGTNYINDTATALKLVEEVGSPGFRLNLDVGTMIANQETTSILIGKVRYINHVHVSEPGLKPIERRTFHRELITALEAEHYQGFVSIEMGKMEDIDQIGHFMRYMKEILEETEGSSSSPNQRDKKW